MSSCSQALRVLDALELREAFDFIASIDDVVRGKTDPGELPGVVAHVIAHFNGED
jgi:hypothetical protein